MTPPNEASPRLTLEDIEVLGGLLQEVQKSAQSIVFGQENVIQEVLVSMLAGGHHLLVGAPGLAKTRLVATLGTIFGLDRRRVQFTPDLMPSDILGTEILEEDDAGKRHFRFIEGPVFCQLLMADEINRASPRTQSALLEAMQEHQVTIAGQRRPLPEPFHVLATQNPIEQEGTYPLPEAQLDRFLLQTLIDYPSAEAERSMLLATTGPKDQYAEPVLDAAQFEKAQAAVRAMPIGDALLDSVLALVRLARPGGPVAEYLQWGPGPRASQALSLTMRARALSEGRESPDHQDLAALAAPALRHRMALTFAARAEGKTIEGLIDEMVTQIL